MSGVTVVYYFLCGWLAAILIANFIKAKENVQELALYLTVLIPIILRLCRVN